MTELKQWYDDMQDAVWAVPGVNMTDLDEGKNRLEIGVDEKAVERAVEEELAKLGIPREALIIGVRERPVIGSHTLQDKIGIIEAGYQIASSHGICTLGFNTDRSGEAGFVTAGHCTEPLPWDGGVDGTNFYQPTVAPVNLIGVETIDPTFFSGGLCPAGRVCRYSNSAFLKKEPGAARDLG